jgi:protease-4
MMLDADRLTERRRLKRRLSLWRIGAILAVVALVIAIAGSNARREGGFLASLGIQPHVARVNIDGFISDDREQRKLMADLEKSSHVRGVILYINSPGGTTAGAEALYLSIRKLAEKKPVAAVFGTMATSAAYLAGIAADHIVARGNSITGSVGVILQWAEVSELLNKLGVRMEEIRSGPLKAVPSPFTPTDPGGRGLAEEMVNESRDWFVGLVSERRPKVTAVIDEVKSGRIYTGRQALQIGLIDSIGDEDTAREWMQEKGVSKDLGIREWKAQDSGGIFSLRGVSNGALALLEGLGVQFHRFVIEGLSRVNYLDGLVSLWHPQNNK